MDILKMRINNLFQKYSVELDMRRKVNILYGANGIGKTTILKFYQALTNNDFIEILRWDFDSIELLAYEHGKEGGERSFFIERKDLLPDIETLKYYYAKYSERNYPFLNHDDDHDRVEKNAEQLFVQLMDRKLYYKFLCNCLFNTPNSMEINMILKEHDYYNKLYKNTIPALLKQMEEQRGRRDCARYLAFTKFSKDFVERKNRYIETCVYDECKIINTYYLDLVKSFEFDCPEKAVTVVKSKTLEWLSNASSFLGQGDEDFEKKPTEIYDILEYLSGPKNLLKSSEYLEHIAGNDYWLFLMDLYANIRDFTTNIYTKNGEKYSFAQNCIVEFIRTRKININSFISAYYYNAGFISQVNKIVANLCEKVVNGEIYWGAGEDDYRWIDIKDLEKYQITIDQNFSDADFLMEYFRDEQNLYFIENYIRPIICENFSVSAKECIANTDGSDYEDEQTSNAFLCYVVYKEILPLLLEPENKNKKISKLEELLNNYFYDKEIEILPSGIFVRIKKGR